MKGGTQPLGYTIIEVMIVLAVSGVMFLIAASFINGKQARTAYTTGVNDMASQIQDVIEQVTDGQYSDIPLTCSPGSPPTFYSSVTPGQGTNAACVFVGKFFHFSLSGDTTKYEVFSLGGNRLTPSDNPAIQLSDIQPVPVEGNGVDLTAPAAAPQDLQITDIKINGTIPSEGFGLIQTSGTVNAQDPTQSTYSSGAQSVELVYAPGLTSSNLNETNAISVIRTNGIAETIPPDTPPPAGTPISSVTLCVTDGTRYDQLDIGSTNGNGNLNVDVIAVGSAATC